MMKNAKSCAALLLSAAMLLGSTPVLAEETKGVSGTATAEAMGLEETVTVSLTLEDGAIVAVEAATDKEEETVGRMALDELPGAMVENNTVNVDVVSGATATSNAVISAATTAYLEILGEELNLDAWAKGLGYLKASDYNMVTGVDAVASATVTGQGGLNFGDIDLPDEVKTELLLNYLQGAEGNYREMYQIATSYNNVPTIGSVEYVLDPSDMVLIGSSEANTGKLNNMLVNPNVDLYWTRQIRKGDVCSEEMPVTPTYFMSYGVQITGKFVPVDWANLEEDEKAYYIQKARTYYETLGAQYASITEQSDEDLYNYMCSFTASTFYLIVPDRVVMTSPWFLAMFDSGYARQFVDEELAAKLADIVKEQYPEAMGLTSMDFAAGTSTGLKTQQTIVFER